ncbi:MAG: hypothetical protein GY913_08015 [Proteobacteria bacterium]|nr:hypothetical protein [Pseudomonadota bacterium]
MGIADTLGKLYARYGRPWAAPGYVVLETAESDPTAAPTVSSGTAAASGSEPDGSVYLGASGLEVRQGSAWGPLGGAAALADPGDAAAIPVTRSATIAITTGAVGETNTVAIPGALGLKLVLVLDVDGGGDRVVTFASGINVGGDTVATLGTARQVLIVESIQIAGALAWEVTGNVGSVALS